MLSSFLVGITGTHQQMFVLSLGTMTTQIVVSTFSELLDHTNNYSTQTGAPVARDKLI